MTETAIGARRGVPVTAEEETLTQAATRIRALGEKATPGPWRFDGETGGNDEMGWPSECTVVNAVPVGARGIRRSMTVVASGVADESVDTSRDYLVPHDAAWIAAVSPVVASALADMLDRAARARWARDVALLQVPGASLGYEPWTDDALVVARAVLGEDGAS